MISEQAAQRTELLHTTTRLESLLKIQSAILHAKSAQAIAEIALERLERIIPNTRSFITLFSPSYSEVSILAGRNISIESGVTFPADKEQVEAMKRDEALLISDITAIPNKTAGQQIVISIGGRSLLAVPLIAHGVLIGTLSLIEAEPRVFSDEDIQVARQVGNSVAIAIHNAQLLEKERDARREAETLREVAASMNASLEQEELLSLILTLLKRVLHYDSATILLVENDSLTPVAQKGISVQRKEIIEQLEQLPPNILRLSLNPQPRIIHDTREDPEWIVYPGTEFIRCWMGVPLIVKETFIGLLMLDCSEPNFYKDQDAATALTFANHAATAIENARLYTEIRQYAEELEARVAERTNELSALYEVTAVSSQHLDLSETLDRMISVISNSLKCRTVTIHILDQSSSTLRIAAYKNLSPAMVEYAREMPIDHFTVQKALESKEATVYINPPSDPRLADAPISEFITYSIGTPIYSEDKVLGTIGIATDRKKPPSREDIALLTSIADHIGVAIENARLRQQSEQFAVLQERERLARDLHDSATQSLFSLTLFAAAAREHLSSGHLELVQEQLVELEETAVQTHKEMRLLLYELRPTALEKEGLEEALRQRIQMVEFRSGIRGHVSVLLSSKLSFSIEQVLFQVANEALNNTLKHSRADTVLINIVDNSTHVNMRIRDNGHGFTTEDAEFNAGMGIGNMRQRVETLGGTFYFESELTSGTTIVVHIPLEPEEPTGIA